MGMSLNSMDGYPPGVCDANFDRLAGYDEMPETKVDITCSNILSKTETCYTTDYVRECDEFSYYEDFSDTDKKKAFTENHYTALELIEEFKCILECIENKDYSNKLLNPHRIKNLIEECSGWEEDDAQFDIL